MDSDRLRLPARRLAPRALPLVLLAALLATLCLVVARPDGAGAITAQQRYDRAQAKLSDISDTVDGLKAQIAEDNRAIDALLGNLMNLRAEAAALREKLAAKQAELEETEAELRRQRDHLERVRSRLGRAVSALEQRLVAMYKTGTPDMSELVMGTSDFSDLVSRDEYVRSIQDYDEAVIERVEDLRDQVKAMVERMAAQRERLERARDAIAADERRAVAARDELEAQRAEFLATRDMRQDRIDALEAKAGSIEENLPDLTADPASSSAAPSPPPVPGQTAVLMDNGLAAAPEGAPPEVKAAIEAANAIESLPYVWGGGHGSFESSGYDCSGAVSYALHGGGLLTSPLDSTGLTTWGEPGEGSWITVYGNSGHAYAVIAGLRWDTSDTGGTGPGWHTDLRDNVGFIARHPSGL